MATIDILLATYNGARYLPELLESLERQTYKDWRLLVRDDGSSDESLSIVEDWGRREGATVRILRDDRGGLGAAANFGALLEVSDAPYFMPCDQDDVWLAGKTSDLLSATEAVEAQLGSDTPLFVFGDLRVVDAELRPIHESLRRYMRIAIPPREQLLKKLMIQNVATGCASIGNAALRQVALPIPRAAAMHDWWLALVAAGFGELVDHQDAVVLYRQHGDNVIGAKSWSLSHTVARVRHDPAAAIERARSHVVRTQSQAKEFVTRYSPRLDPQTVTLFDEYGTLGTKPFLHRKAFAFRNGLWTDFPLVNAGFLTFI